MTDINIPPEAVEAAARADYENWRDMYAVRGDTLEWEDIKPELQNEHRLGVTAALRAGIAAWPGMFYHTARPDEEACIFLPLPQEARDE